MRNTVDVQNIDWPTFMKVYADMLRREKSIKIRLVVGSNVLITDDAIVYVTNNMVSTTWDPLPNAVLLKPDSAPQVVVSRPQIIEYLKGLSSMETTEDVQRYLRLNALRAYEPDVLKAVEKRFLLTWVENFEIYKSRSLFSLQKFKETLMSSTGGIVLLGLISGLTLMGAMWSMFGPEQPVLPDITQTAPTLNLLPTTHVEKGKWTPLWSDEAQRKKWKAPPRFYMANTEELSGQEKTPADDRVVYELNNRWDDIHWDESRDGYDDFDDYEDGYRYTTIKTTRMNYKIRMDPKTKRVDYYTDRPQSEKMGKVTDLEMRNLLSGFYMTGSVETKGKRYRVYYFFAEDTDAIYCQKEFELPQTYYIEQLTQNPILKAGADVMMQNLVCFNGPRSISYATMLTSQIGVVPRHTALDRAGNPSNGKVRYKLNGVEDERDAKIIYSTADKELVFFQLYSGANPATGPFKDITSKLRGIDTLATATSVTGLIPHATGHHLPSGPLKIETTIKDLFTNSELKAWRMNAAYMYYGTAEIPYVSGSCGTPYFTTINGQLVLVGVHTVQRVHSMQVGAAIVCSEAFNEMVLHLRQNRDKVQGMVIPENFIHQPQFEPEIGDYEDVYPTYMPTRIVSMIKAVTPQDLQPHGPGLVTVGHINAHPSDTKSKKFKIDATCGEVFPSTKVPTLTEEEILSQMPEKILPDANGNLHVGYTRLAAANKNVGNPDLLHECMQAGSELARHMIEEFGIGPINPWTIEEAVSGTTLCNPINRESSNGSLIDIICKVRGKAAVIDYDDTTRKVIYRNKIVKEWLEQQWEMAGDGVRFHIPVDVGLKSETLPPEKLHKKRVFAKMDTVSVLNQKRLFAPVQSALNLGTRHSRFTLTFDPLTEADEFVKGFKQPGRKFAAFDSSSFDFTVTPQILQGVAEFMKEFYKNGKNQIPEKTLKRLSVFIQNAGAASLIYNGTLMKKRGGVVSGMSQTSLIDSIAVLIILKVTMNHLFEGMSTSQFMENVISRHGGDDLVIAVTPSIYKEVSVKEITDKIHELFAMTFTLDVKDDEITIQTPWLEFSECSFLSRTFVPLDIHPNVYISKIKEASIGSTLNWTHTGIISEQKTQLEQAYVEIYPYGRERYTQYRIGVLAFARKHGLSTIVPDYDECGEMIWAAIVTKERKSGTCVESTTATFKTSPPLLSITDCIEMPIKKTTTKAAALKALDESNNFEELYSKPAITTHCNTVNTNIPTSVVKIPQGDSTLQLPFLIRGTETAWLLCSPRNEELLPPHLNEYFIKFDEAWKAVTVMPTDLKKQRSIKEARMIVKMWKKQSRIVDLKYWFSRDQAQALPVETELVSTLTIYSFTSDEGIFRDPSAYQYECAVPTEPPGPTYVICNKCNLPFDSCTYNMCPVCASKAAWPLKVQFFPPRDPAPETPKDTSYPARGYDVCGNYDFPQNASNKFPYNIEQILIDHISEGLDAPEFDDIVNPILELAIIPPDELSWQELWTEKTLGNLGEYPDLEDL